MLETRTPTVERITAELVFDSHALIGEAPMWDAREERFLWVDNVGGTVNELRMSVDGAWTGRQLHHFDHLVASVIPRENGEPLITGGVEVRVPNAAGDFEVFARLDADPTRVRINETECDSRGRLWANTATLDLSLGGGGLYRIDPDGSVHVILEGVTMGNGMAWSPDGTAMYFIDSSAGRIDAFDFDEEAGTISGRRTLRSFGYGEGWGDGMSSDSEGNLWVAFPIAGEVRCFTPFGELIRVVECGANLFTASCAFGGSDGATMVITSGSVELPAVLLMAIGYPASASKAAADAPGAGGVFACRPGVTGTPSHRFAG